MGWSPPHCLLTASVLCLCAPSSGFLQANIAPNLGTGSAVPERSWNLHPWSGQSYRVGVGGAVASHPPGPVLDSDSPFHSHKLPALQMQKVYRETHITFYLMLDLF